MPIKSIELLRKARDLEGCPRTSEEEVVFDAADGVTFGTAHGPRTGEALLKRDSVLECGSPLPFSTRLQYSKRQRTATLQNLAEIRAVQGKRRAVGKSNNELRG
jgi:hypothetical protein